MKADLHCHSWYSDGVLSPAEVVQLALANEVTHLAITDHDCTAGLSAASEESAASELTLIPGVEISCEWRGLEIHVVGLFINSSNEVLQALLASQQKIRRARMVAMNQKLEAMGVSGLMAYLDGLNCVALTRSHVANFLVQAGVSPSRPKAFKRYLRKEGRLFVAVQWCALAEAIAAIRSAGGIAVLAHPGRYPLNRKKLTLLIEDFHQAGGEALEASYPNIDPEMARYLEVQALQTGLMLSLGSDFHDPAAQWTDIGKVPPLSRRGSDQAVWHHPVWDYCQT
ncbi:MAG: PHP domain-containing protein [Pseudomonadales bacterium]|nr:PHP domain-containing protein [Pseudomonadales bacterium]